LVQTCCSNLLSIADRTKHEFEKHSCKNNVCVRWQTDAIGLWKCDPGLPPSWSLTEAVTTITVWELSDTPRTLRGGSEFIIIHHSNLPIKLNFSTPIW
jgi:hypothetical protein